MKVYIDSDCKCHAAREEETWEEAALGFFDGKCQEYIEGFRFVPEGRTWTREDGEVFRGEMIAPWKNYEQLAACQAVYERMLARQEDMRAALEALYAGVRE